MALEARAFSAPGRRTTLRPLPDSPGRSGSSAGPLAWARSPLVAASAGRLPAAALSSRCRCDARRDAIATPGRSKPVLDGIDLDVEPGRVVGDRRAERVRQVDALPRRRRPGAGGDRRPAERLGRRSTATETATLKPHEAAQRCGILVPEPGHAAVGHERRRSGRRSRSARATSGCRSTRSSERVEAAMATLQIGDLAERDPHRLSGGQAQLVALASRRRPPADRCSSSTSRRASSTRPAPASSATRSRRLAERRHGDPPRGAQDGARRAGRRRGRAARRRARRVRRAGRDRPRRPAARRARRRSAAEREDRHGAGRRRPRGSTRRHRPRGARGGTRRRDAVAGGDERRGDRAGGRRLRLSRTGPRALDGVDLAHRSRASASRSSARTAPASRRSSATSTASSGRRTGRSRSTVDRRRAAPRRRAGPRGRPRVPEPRPPDLRRHGPGARWRSGRATSAGAARSSTPVSSGPWRSSGLTGDEATNPYDLGFSRRKLLALASILAMETPIVILDEPTTGQDARGVSRVQQIVADLSARRPDRHRDQPRHALRRGVVRAGRRHAGRSDRPRRAADGRLRRDDRGRRWPRRTSSRRSRPGSGRGSGSATTPTEAALVSALATGGDRPMIVVAYALGAIAAVVGVVAQRWTHRHLLPDSSSPRRQSRS